MAKRRTTTDGELRTRWIGLAVKDLREFGYPSANTKNVLTDRVYSTMFERQIKDALEVAGDQGWGDGTQAVRVLTALLSEIKANRKQ
jgi:hypothetical protein